VEFAPAPKPEIAEPQIAVTSRRVASREEPVFVEPTRAVETARVAETLRVTEPVRVTETARAAETARVTEPVRVTEPTRVVETARVQSAEIAEPAIIEPSIESEAVKMLVLDEIEPLDYLEAEIRKVDKALGAEFVKNESPSIVTHAVIGVVDLLTIAASCSLFLATMRIADGNFSTPQTRFATAAVVVVITFFYLLLTHRLCGRTFGMMLTNTRVVDALAFDAPTPTQATLRAAGYFVAAAPGMIGILWAAFNQKHRGWQDIISGTVVVRDF